MKSRTEVVYDYLNQIRLLGLSIMTDTAYTFTLQQNGYPVYDNYPSNQIDDHIILPPHAS